MTSRRPKTVITLILGLVTPCLHFASALAQEETTLLTAEQQIEIIETFSDTILEHYVLPDQAAVLVDDLHQSQVRNSYTSTKTMNEFLNTTNTFIQSTANDKHLRVLSPRKFDQMMAMFYGDDQEHNEQPSEEHSSLSNPLSVVGVSRVSEISRDGLNQTGYLALERFDGSARSVAFMERVFSSFTESDNIVIDLRNCGGGDAEMVKVLSSYFFDEPTHLLNTTMPGEGHNSRTVVERWTAPDKLSQYFAQKPIKILISSKSFSAAESFAFGMQAAGRAELVGETTGGGGYINDFFPLAHGFGASVSVGRTYDPRTGKDWQAIGVIPEVQIEPDHALIAALTSFTEQSGKLDKLQGEEIRIYQLLQKYANAWYGADHEAMRGVISDDFTGIYSDQGGAEIERISSEQLINSTKDGVGQRENEIHYNRIIRDIDISDRHASVTLILRETLHYMSLTKQNDTWLISYDDFKDKQRGPA